MNNKTLQIINFNVLCTLRAHCRVNSFTCVLLNQSDFIAAFASGNTVFFLFRSIDMSKFLLPQNELFKACARYFFQSCSNVPFHRSNVVYTLVFYQCHTGTLIVNSAWLHGNSQSFESCNQTFLY